MPAQMRRQLNIMHIEAAEDFPGLRGRCTQRCGKGQRATHGNSLHYANSITGPEPNVFIPGNVPTRVPACHAWIASIQREQRPHVECQIIADHEQGDDLEDESAPPMPGPATPISKTQSP